MERARRRPRRRRHARDARPLVALPGAAVGVDRHPRDRRPLRPARRSSATTTGDAAADASTDAAVLAEVSKQQAHPAAADRPPLARHVRRSTRGRAGTSSRSCSRSAGRPRTSPGYTPGTPHPIELDETNWTLRPYQRKAVDIFTEGGSGVVVLPCGAGKTLVGAGAMADTKTTTLILVTNTVSARQWRDELLKRTSLTAEEIGEYSGQMKEIKPVTIATYQILTAKRKRPVRAPRAARRARLGPHRLRRGAPAARAGLQAHRRPAGPPPARPDRHARARGRPRGRRLQPDRPQAVRRSVEGDRGPGLHLPRRLLRGARRPARPATASSTRPPPTTSATASPRRRTRRSASSASSSSATPASGSS